MDTCSEIAKFTLMVEKPLYKFRFFISLFVATLFCCLLPSSSKVLYVLIFNIVAVGCYYGIDVYTSKNIEDEKLTELIDRCNTERNVKKENLSMKLDKLSFEDVQKEPNKVLDENESNDFNKRGEISLKSVKETFANPYKDDNKNNNLEYQGNISINSFKNQPAAFESTYQMIETPPLNSPPPQVEKNGCLLGKDNCNPICSGNNANPCNLQTPSPGPQWQPQLASTVQNRLNNGEFVPNYCPL